MSNRLKQDRDALIQMRRITKRFPGVVANDEIDLDLYSGEIHTLLGENGAGKTTLLNILSGMHQPDEGTITIRDREVRFKSPHDALSHGIGTVYQHFTLVPNLSVIENVILGANNGFFLDLRRAEGQIREMLEKLDLDIDPQLQVQYLSLGQQQRVEIIKVLFREPETLLLDEPTSVLTPGEIRELFRMVKQLKAEGKNVVFITHKLQEALEISDRITILRNGRHIETLGPETLATEDREAVSNRIVKLMFGGVPPQESSSRSREDSREPVLSLEHITIIGSRGVPAVRDLSLDLHTGEIFGIAGVGGSGQKELGEAIAGQSPVINGRVRIEEVDITNKGVPFAMDRRIAYITDDRIEEGTVSDLSVAENAVMRIIDREPMSRWSILNWQAILDHAMQLIHGFNIKVGGPKVRTGTLSGGNIQKLLLSRELSRKPKVLVCNEPTHGLDIKTAHFVRQTLREQADRGTAILLISSDLDEILEMSDRIGVMYNGQLLAVLPATEADRETIGRLILGKRSS
ncbi:MAG: ABC transporter ATP-binding protein [Candidatus Bipolaricaulia bacterium]